MTDFIKRKLTRGDCLKEARPCTRHCPYRLDGAESCALDVADRGGATQEEVALLLGVSPSLVQRIEREALDRACAALGVPVPSREDYAVTERNVVSEEDAQDDATFAAAVGRGPVTVYDVAGRLPWTVGTVRSFMNRLVDKGRMKRTRLPVFRRSYVYETTEEAEAAE